MVRGDDVPYSHAHAHPLINHGTAGDDGGDGTSNTASNCVPLATCDMVNSDEPDVRGLTLRTSSIAGWWSRSSSR